MDKRRYFYPECRFGEWTEVDTTLRLYQRVKSLITPESVVLDIGCGRGARLPKATPFVRSVIDYKGFAKRVIGIDVEEIGQTNPSLDEFRLMSPRQPWPVEDASIDVAICDQVIEHIEDTAFFFTEVDRVLKPGGVICIRTPNRFGYVAMIAKLLPESLHRRVLKRAQNRTADIFPTFNRCNTSGALKRAFRRRGYEAVVTGCDGEPAYFEFSIIAYTIMVYVHRVLPGALQNQLLCFARKPNVTL